MVLDPYGDVIAESRALGDDMVVADLDASVLPTSSGRRWLRARRPELYESLTRPTGQEQETRRVRFGELPLASFPDVHLVQRGTEPVRQLERVAVRPEMHEKEARAVGQHMAVKGRDGDAVVAQGSDHGVHLIPDQDEVPGNRRLAPTGRLDVDRRRETHRGWNVDAIRRDLLCPRHADLIHAAVDLPVIAEDLPDLGGVDAEASGRYRRGGGTERCLGEGQRGVDRRRESRRGPIPADVH